MRTTLRQTVAKEPAVTFGFWLIKILATTLGETGGDAVTMSLNLGYLIGTTIFAAIFVVAVSAQIAAARFRPFLYGFVIVPTTTAARCSPTSATARSELATSEARCCCSPALWSR